MTWNEQDVPDQTGRTVLITGANSGLGLRSAQVLAGKGARVLMGCRSPERGAAALETVRAEGGKAELVRLDLADLASVRAAAAEVRELTGDTLHVLMNNAGVMATPRRSTVDGFELQLGTNHMGHAALTWLLMPALRGTEDARVVTLSSLAHRGRGFDLEDLDFERRRYTPTGAYSQSKLANLLFAFELHRRGPVVSVAAHPGMTETDLVVNSARSRVTEGVFGHAITATAKYVNKLVTQSLAKGALPQLYAATAPDVQGGEYYGPGGPGEIFGAPAKAKPRKLALDEAAAGELWRRTAEMTGVTPDPA